MRELVSFAEAMSDADDGRMVVEFAVYIYKELGLLHRVVVPTKVDDIGMLPPGPIDPLSFVPDYRCEWHCASVDELVTSFIKRRSLIAVEIPAHEHIALMTHELGVLETIRANPHPAICVYLGCEVMDGKVAGLCFEPLQHDFDKAKRLGPGLDPTLPVTAMRSAVAHLASLGLVYTDPKPEHVMQRPDGTWCLIDFGDCYPAGTTASRAGGTLGWSDGTTVVSDEATEKRVRTVERYMLEGVSPW